MPHEATRRFERALCEYTGAPFAVAVSSCTAAIELSLALHAGTHSLVLPKRTYVGVAQVAKRLGYRIQFEDFKWTGSYALRPTRVIDAAKRFTSGMYERGTYMCVSFHVAKILGDSQGGAILHDDETANQWFRKARFDGRTEGVPLRDDTKIVPGFHCYMSSDVANRLHARITAHSFPRHNPDQCPEGFLEREYGDLSQLECFK